jgi:hypothetical protein
MKIKYSSSVMVAAGWRSVLIIANAEQISPKRVKIIDCLDVDGLGIHGYGSRTGAKRQTFNVGGIAKREVGIIKNLSSVEVIGE